MFLAARPASACGFDFPAEVLYERAQRLTSLPEGTFAHEVQWLVPRPPGGFLAVEDEPPAARAGGGAAEHALYHEGATLFQAGKDQAQACQKFAALLALLPAERRHFSIMAAFMLGHCARDAGAFDEAHRRFAQVRALARQGFDDPLGLAVASYGEQGRIYLYHDDPLHLYGMSQGLDVRIARYRHNHPLAAIRAYARQASFGSSSGMASLLFIARRLVESAALRERVIRDPLGQRLLTTYLWTRGKHEVDWRRLGRLYRRLARIPALDGADRLAVAAWNGGRFQLVERLAAGLTESTLALWVKAKLAHKRGDRSAADAYLARAAARYPAERGLVQYDAHYDQSQDWSNGLLTWPYGDGAECEAAGLRPIIGQLEGERAILALGRNDFVAAMDHALASGSWLDMAYVAEQVLSVDELLTYVRKRRRTPLSQRGCAARRCEYGAIVDELFAQDSLCLKLEYLLARRLMRAGRYAEALNYFPHGHLEQEAGRYAKLRQRARTAPQPVDRAEALYEASKIIRKLGLELSGTELAPDWAAFSGRLDLTQVRKEYHESSRPVHESSRPVPMTPEERARVKASAPHHRVRFHYREVAADLAEQAAYLVPPRSQAYGALLFTAIGYIQNTNHKRRDHLYRTYLRNGCSCPDLSFDRPDFERVRHPPPKPLRLPQLPRKRVIFNWVLKWVLGIGR